jgi:ferredoxin--NADP+ reductase
VIVVLQFGQGNILAKFDVAEKSEARIGRDAVEALANSKIKEVYLLGRRGPAQAAFTNPEIKEVGELKDADILTRADETQLDDLSAASIAGDRVAIKKVEILQSYSIARPLDKPKKLNLRLLVSPVELIGDEQGCVKKMRLVRNTLVASDSGSLSAKATDQFEEIEVGLVFRSVGYRGVPLPDVPFNDRWGVILNQAGRVLDSETKQPLTGLYTSGWIKRGPSGVVGTNKPDSVETVTCMLEDLRADKILHPANADAASIEQLVRDRKSDYFSSADWKQLDQLEQERGKVAGRPRLKFTNIEEMKQALGK